jgi:hypothetical protein
MSASKPHLPSLASLSLSSVVPIVTLKRRRGTSEIASIDEGVYQAHKDRYNKLKGYHLFSVDDLPFLTYVEMRTHRGPDMFEVHSITSLFLTFSCFSLTNPSTFTALHTQEWLHTVGNTNVHLSFIERYTSLSPEVFSDEKKARIRSNLS